jgi:PilZ domain
MNNLTGTEDPAAPRLMQGTELSAAEPSPEDKRRHPRYECDGYAEVFLPHGGLLFRGRILNLSLSGCYVETAMARLERGTLVEVYFVTNQLQFRVQANIAEVRQKRGVGISFLNPSRRRAMQIAALIGELAEKRGEATEDHSAH